MHAMKFKKKDICEADSSSLISIQILVKKKNNHKIILCSLHTIEHKCYLRSIKSVYSVCELNRSDNLVSACTQIVMSIHCSFRSGGKDNDVHILTCFVLQMSCISTNDL